MKTLHVLRLIADREIRDRLGNRAFVVGSLLALVAMIALIVVPALLADDGPAEVALGVVGDRPAGFEEAALAAGVAQDVEVTITALDDRTAANGAVEDGTVDAVVLGGEALLVEDDASGLVLGLAEQALQQSALLERLRESGVPPDQVQGLLEGREPLEVVTPAGTEQENEARFGVALVATVLLFLMVQMNGGALLSGTVEEKSSRVVEVLLGSVRPWQLLAGKLAGISVIAFAQLLVYAGTVLALNELIGAFELPSATGRAVVVGLIMFVLGFGMYAALYAVAGSMATSIEDAQSSAGPLGFLVVAVYMAVIISVIPNPDGVLARVLTYLPPSAPFAVPARAAVGSVPTWEVALAAAVTALGTVMAIRVAGRLYSAAILSGGTLSWRTIMRAEPIR